jgi:hypothetical protein
VSFGGLRVGRKFRHRSPRILRMRENAGRVKVGRRVLNDFAPDRAKIKIGGPLPFPQGELEWDREKKERIAVLRRRLNT